MRRKVSFGCFLVLLLGALCFQATFSRGEETRDSDKLFPFVLSYEPTDSITNLSEWLDRPAGKHGFIRAENGHFVTDAGRIRLWATNLCFEACFPTKEEAERLARRLASLGINCVRMHHMDNRHIWGKSPNKLTIDPEMLDKLDYLIYQLKLHGIYTNINLHVSRQFGPAEGFPAVQGLPNYDKGIDNFEPRMIEYQKKYARDLLTHINPYTGTAYINEPAIAMVEINNENAAFDEYRKGAFDHLPEPYASQLRKLWNAWLKKKYGSDDALRKAWNAQRQPLGEEILKNRDFSGQWEKVWNLQRDNLSEVIAEVIPNGFQGKPVLRLRVVRNGQQSWIPQLSQGGFPVQKGQVYTLRFWLKADKPGRTDVNCMMNHDPWERLGLSADVQTSAEWKEYRLSFVADRDDPNARITFSQLRPGTYELADVSLRPGGVIGLEEGQSLANDTVPIVPARGPQMTAAARADFADFLWDLERDYWWEMYRFLKEDLKLKPLVAGTQLSYSPVHIQAGLDYIDAHAYWQHPVFPGRPWDPENWYVRNLPLVNQPGGTLSGLANRRVEGLPFTVSEYNHPAPNEYAAEGFPMIAAFGAFQDWDGIFSFTYSHSRDYEPRKITGFFDIKSEVTKLVHMPACVAMFYRGDVQPARTAVVVGMTREKEQSLLRETLNPWTLTADRLGIPANLSLLHRVAMALKEPSNSVPPPTLAADQKVFLSDTQQICWDVSQPGAGVFLVNSPRTKLVTGFPAGRTFNLDGVQVQIGKTELGWATVSLTVIKGDGFDRPGRILLAATGKVQNTGWDFRKEGDRVTVGRRWGDEPILCEGVPARIVLPVSSSRVKVYALDEAGRRRDAVTVSGGDQAALEIGPQYRTLWYEIEIQ
ncbi:MAG: carbohydrate binding domain-containing protein [Thermogutta sp.]|uniref:carbohydrate binding domain-containing protein n=1 Tax=Thermogutta sp. TaxID=1962930 RepID=UPI0019BB1591|nr:carbohydrate binding domain-containing protein [Thermogutta sp.]MBC7352337.1 carbohydrate binding domain-containing protein [Thermogutta sp.]